MAGERILIAVLCLLLPQIAEAACQPPHYKIDGAEATDEATGLVWRRCGLGMTWQAGKGCTGKLLQFSQDSAAKEIAALGEGWRMPKVSELYTLVDNGCGVPTIDTSVFPDVVVKPEGAPYWTSTKVGATDLIVEVDFSDGSYDGHSKGIPLPVRPVKGP